MVQDLVIRAHNIRYRLERWETPDGRTLLGRLPTALEGRHFGPALLGYILYQHHHCQVTQPLQREPAAGCTRTTAPKFLQLSSRQSISSAPFAISRAPLSLLPSALCA